MLPIFGCDPHIGLFWSTCCWQHFLAPGGPPATLPKISETAAFTAKITTNAIFSILNVENRVVEGWGGAAQLWAGKKLCSPNKSKITQKKISDQAHPLHQKIRTSKMRILANRNQKNRVYFET